MKTALIAICRDEKNIEEWCRYHLKLGFSAIYVALNNCEPEYVSYCRSLALENVFFTEFNPSESRLAPQFAFYNAWLKTFGSHFDWAAFLDDDEYLWLGGSDAETFFSNHEDDYAVAFNWRFFSAKEDVAEPADSLLKRFTWRQKDFNRHVKIAAHLSKIKAAGLQDRCFLVNPHLLGHPACQIPTVTPEGLPVRGPYNEWWQPDSDVFVAHFYSKTKEEFAAKIRRGRPDCPRGSTAQYFNCPERMWDERAKRNMPDVRDTRLLEFMEGN